MKNEYVEIVHTSPVTLDSYRKEGPLQKAIADRISKLEKTIGVTYEMGDLDSDPFLPKDTPMRIGGGLWEICVYIRTENLKKLGYENVMADRRISFAYEDAFRDAGLLKDKDMRMERYQKLE
jgi:hypothetical protein